MKEWWQQLNLREQRLVTVMGGVFLVFVFYSFIWQPLNENLLKANKKLQRQQVLLTWVSENIAHYQNIKGKSKPSKSGGSLSSIINRTASQYDLVITRLQPQGNDMQVWIDSAPFTQLLFWLEYIGNKKGLRVKAIDLATSEREGEVKIRRLQLTKL